MKRYLAMALAAVLSIGVTATAFAGVDDAYFFGDDRSFFMKKKKIFLMGIAAGSIMLTQGVFAAEIDVIPSQNALLVQSGDVANRLEAVPAYMYQDNNYFMLRDIGRIVGYQVDWDENTKNISMIKDKKAQNFDDMSKMKQTGNVVKNHQTIIIDESKYENKECLNIDGYNYFKLRDLAKVMNFTCDWDNNENTIVLTVHEDNDSETSTTDLSVERFLDADLNQKIIEDDVSYVSGSNDYREIENYIKKNIDKDFNADDYIIKEDDVNSIMPGYASLIIKLDVNGVSANYGYFITCLNEKAVLITFIGEKNSEFDIHKAGTQQLTDEEAKRKAIEADGYDYEVDEQRIYRYFDMKDLTNKCEVETVYVDDGGHYFATSNVF